MFIVSCLNSQLAGQFNKDTRLYQGLSINIDFVFHYLLLQPNLLIECQNVGGVCGKQVEILMAESSVQLFTSTFSFASILLNEQA